MPQPIYAKDPNATLDYSVDWAAWLGATDTIEEASWTAPEGIMVAAETHTATAATVWLSGGTAGAQYQLTCRISTVEGRIDERTITVRVADK